MMKNIFTIFVILFSIIACSKEDLQTSPQASLFSSNYFTTEEEAFQSLVSVYDALGHQTGIDLAWSPYLVMSEVLSDDAYAGGQDAGDGAEEDEFNTFNLSTGNEIVQSIWKRNYYGIYRANFTIEKMQELSNTTEEYRSQIIAEAKFLRAYFYFEQIRFFENIPLITQVLSPSEGNIAQAASEDVYNQIASDLVDGIETLAEDYGAQKGRATKWAAQALLSRVYLFKQGVYGGGLTAGDLTIDETYILAQLEDLIINSGHQLEDNFEDNFNASGEFNAESIFEVVYAAGPVQGDWGSEQGVEGNLAAQMMGPRVANSLVYYRGWAFAIPTYKLYTALSGDPRQDASILTVDMLRTNEPGIEINVGAYQHTGYYNAKYTTRIAERGGEGTPELHNTLNYKVIRYSDVLLMAAELGQNATHINTVRARVGLAPIASYTEDALFNERRLELAGEGIRYWDVLRRGQSYAASELTMSDIGPNYTGADIVYKVDYNMTTRGFLPIPQVEIDISAGQLKQNEGY